MTPRPPAFGPQKGLSLVELMVAMLVGLILTAGAIQIFISSRQTYRVQENLSRMQENARFAMEYLRRDIRMADYWGCVREPRVGPPGATDSNIQNNLNISATFDFAFDQGISGTDGLDNAPDVITLRGSRDEGVRIHPPFMNIAAAALQTNSNNGIEQGDILLVTNCSTGTIFQVSNPDPSQSGTIVHNEGSVVAPGNSQTEFNQTYGAEASIFKVTSSRYFVGDSAGVPALFKQDMNNAPIEIVRGVENMQITYGEDIDGDGVPNYFVPAGTPGFDIDRAVAIRVSLLMRSDDNNVTSRPIDYSFNGQTVTPNDRLLRQVFTSTVAVRNRLD